MKTHATDDVDVLTQTLCGEPIAYQIRTGDRAPLKRLVLDLVQDLEVFLARHRAVLVPRLGRGRRNVARGYRLGVHHILQSGMGASE